MPKPDSRINHREESVSGVSTHDSIWVLDDDASMLRALGRLLTSAGFAVEQFNNPVAFLAKLEADKCRVAILDVWMPIMSGLEVQASLRENSPETRVIVISGRDDPSARQSALAAGALGFLAKPFDDETLVHLVRKAIAA